MVAIAENQSIADQRHSISKDSRCVGESGVNYEKLATHNVENQNLPLQRAHSWYVRNLS